MLDRAKAAQLVAAAEGKIFRQTRSLQWLTAAVWQQLVGHSAFSEALNQERRRRVLPQWQGSLGAIFTIAPMAAAYDVLAVDGSQIYPDHHLQGVDCFLVHTGLCHLSYNQESSVRFAAAPYLFTTQEAQQAYRQSFFAPDLVDLIREDYELALLAQEAAALQGATTPLLCLFDGNVFFWHLEAKLQQIKTVFMERYTAHLSALHELRQPYAGYLSGARFADVVDLVRVGLCESGNACGLARGQLYDLCSMIELLTDAELLAFVLAPGQRTTLFSCEGDLVDQYPPHSKPWFFYLHTGDEVVRIEVPAWIAQDGALVDFTASCSLDQAFKGFGYPVALAEAHAQAVVTGADRAFFYDLVKAQGVHQQRRVAVSPKNLKKKLLGV